MWEIYIPAECYSYSLVNRQNCFSCFEYVHYVFLKSYITGNFSEVLGYMLSNTSKYNRRAEDALDLWMDYKELIPFDCKNRTQKIVKKKRTKTKKTQYIT